MFKTISKIVKHITCVQEAITHLADELRQRAVVHDASKFGEDELKGFARFEDMPEGLEYGSPEYEAAMAKVMEGNNCFAVAFSTQRPSSRVLGLSRTGRRCRHDGVIPTH